MLALRLAIPTRVGYCDDMNTTATVTNRHLDIASKLPTVQAFLAYCDAREAGKSHIYAMHKAHKAGK